VTSFIADIAAAAEALGPAADNVGLIMGIALAPWESEDQRNAFLEQVTKSG